MSTFLFLLVIGLSTSLLSYFHYKNKEKTDKGFIVNYYHLSYRRRFLRDLTFTLPLYIVIIIFTFFRTDWSFLTYFLVCIGLGLLLFGSTSFNYYKWKQTEQD
ncbi:hypothetical protein ACE1TH_11455 [Shouchella sp. JSM 1781072]|uniref:hypothetical protein n=1 Tax=Bacillaceae TaxID=186817 RepID=UPI0020D14314|nr:hypothetical protein [Alkalihalobacillus sp. LMS6]UTR07053.1 hypothetical protein MM326_03200 [Alkalihalobacillus sp. LMS6]